MKLAIIPARGGSKRIPRKNIKEFQGKPIIAWSIEAAQLSNCFDRVIVSTDDEEIADVAKQYRAEVPFIRPPSLSDDYTGTIPVVRHSIEWFNQHSVCPDQVCCIYATAPFVRAEDIGRGLALQREKASDFSVSMTSFPFPIQRALTVSGDGKVEMFNPEYFQTRSQDLVEAYHDAGQFYWGTADAWLSSENLFDDQTTPVFLPRYRVQDIDTLEDWIRAEAMFKVLRDLE